VILYPLESPPNSSLAFSRWKEKQRKEKKRIDMVGGGGGGWVSVLSLLNEMCLLNLLPFGFDSHNPLHGITASLSEERRFEAHKP